MASTRLNNDDFLIGHRDLESLVRMKQLPTVRQVLQRFHCHLNDVKSVRNASHLTINEVLMAWSKAAIPTTIARNAIQKLETLHNTWLLLKKNKGRSSESQRQRELGFTSELDHLFDIAHAEALTMIRITEDRDFLVDQRRERTMYLSTEDKELVQKQERAAQRQQKEEERRKKAILMASTSSSSSATCLDCLTDETESPVKTDQEIQDSDEEFQPLPLRTPKAEKGVKNAARHLFTTHVTGALDRNKISDREALRLMTPIAAALGHDPCALPLSRSTIHRVRKKARIEHAESAMKEFEPQYPLVIHWDGKILPKIVGAGKVDRLPVLVSGDGIQKLLGVPKLAAGTGDNVAKGVYDLLERWKLVDKVEAMSFDTTAANTGGYKGACIILEEMIGRELLWLACRHHVMEIMLAKVFTVCFGPSSSPEIPIFKRFRTVWEGITRVNFRVLEQKKGTGAFIESTVQYLQNVVGEVQVRDDYQELIELTLIVLGSPPAKIHWRAPGPVHHARWMARLLYALKIFIFRDQRDVFKLTKREETQLERLVQFGALLYTQAWMKAPLAAEAPAADLKLWMDLGIYQSIDNEIGTAARTVLERHLWYLSDETVGLALFSDTVLPVDKAKIVQGFSVDPGNRSVKGEPAILKDGVCLGNFSTKRSAQLLSRLKIANLFLTLPPEMWNENSDYQEGRERVKQLRVVNDTAERGVKLFEEFNNLLTNDEEEKQFMLHVVEANRKTVPTQTTKKSVIHSLSAM